MHKSFLRSSLLLGLVLLLIPVLIAQQPTVQDCLGAIPICQEIYEEMNSPEGAGNYTNEINPVGNGGISCMDVEVNSIWYTFTVNKSGNFGFVLTPNEPTDDYDWALFDITNASCGDIFNDPSLQVSCNAAGSDIADAYACNGETGADGKSSYSNQGGGCGTNPPSINSGFTAHNDLVPVQEGNTYVLLVSNWTRSTNGYKIDFGISGDIGIFDDQPPSIANVTVPTDCDVDDILINFSENIQIPSISTGNFKLTGPSGEHSMILRSLSLSVDGTYDRSFSLLTDPPLTEVGSYSFEIVADGNADILDLCGNPLPRGSSYDFEITQVPLLPPDIPSDTILCDDETLSLDVTDPQATSYLWPDGSTLPTFEIEATGSYEVQLTNDCGTVSSTINVSYANCGNCEVYIPNAITPNGDGINDVLQVFSDCDLQQFSISIFDRWGGKLYNSDNMQNAWNGRVDDQLLSPGVYIYVAQYQVQELGEVFFRTIAGDVTIIY